MKQAQTHKEYEDRGGALISELAGVKLREFTLSARGYPKPVHVAGAQARLDWSGACDLQEIHHGCRRTPSKQKPSLTIVFPTLISQSPCSWHILLQPAESKKAEELISAINRQAMWADAHEHEWELRKLLAAHLTQKPQSV
ncbi:MAG: hypothetical protein ACKVWR_04200 [Acidimicrobiales bacterium]